MKSDKKISMIRTRIEQRPGNFDTKFENLDAFFTSNYIFASKFVKDKNCLDAGCGTGYGSKFLADAGASLVVGVDIDSKTIDKCIKNYESTANLKFAMCDVTHLNFKDETFDVVVSFEVIEHLVDYNLYIEEIRRVLKKGGLLILSTPNKNVFSPNLENPIIVEHFHEFYPDELYTFLKQHFEEVSLYGRHIINKDLSESEQNFRQSKKYAITVMLSKNNFIRNSAKYVPYSIRKILSGCSISFKNSDLHTSKENINDSYALIATASKNN
ncbi:MAG: methyltransferase domain-containing protein [Methanolobus sp.]|nr:methyltransferase domain-containing protein [Methanolobus sp.]